MKRLKLVFYKILVGYYQKRWQESIRYMDMYIDDRTSVEFRKAAYLTTKYGDKITIYLDKIMEILEEVE